MTFTADSFLVKLYVRKIKEGSITREDVPPLYNLYDEVLKQL